MLLPAPYVLLWKLIVPLGEPGMRKDRVLMAKGPAMGFWGRLNSPGESWGGNVSEETLSVISFSGVLSLKFRHSIYRIVKHL